MGIELWHGAECREQHQRHHDHFDLEQQSDVRHRGSVKTTRPATPRQNMAPITRQLSAVTDHGQNGTISPGATNMTSPWIRAKNPMTPTTHRASGLRRSSSAAGTPARAG